MHGRLCAAQKLYAAQTLCAAHTLRRKKRNGLLKSTQRLIQGRFWFQLFNRGVCFQEAALCKPAQMIYSNITDSKQSNAKMLARRKVTLKSVFSMPRRER